MVSLVAVGAALIAEAVGAIGGRWRDDIAEVVTEIGTPSWEPWISTILGAGLAVVGVGLVAAQFAPPKRGLRKVHEVYSGDDGETRIRGRAAIAAARHEIAAIDHVRAVDARIAAKTMTVEVQIDDEADLADVEAKVRDQLDHEFWINLGLADFAVNLLLTHHPRPPRVR
jgi:hypothetical protein